MATTRLLLIWSGVKCKYKCNLFTHGAPAVHKNSFEKPVHSRIELEFVNVGFWGGGKTGVPGRRKTSRCRAESQQQTQPTYDPSSGKEIRVTLKGGEYFHHWAIPAPRPKIGSYYDTLWYVLMIKEWFHSQCGEKEMRENWLVWNLGSLLRRGSKWTDSGVASHVRKVNKYSLLREKVL